METHGDGGGQPTHQAEYLGIVALFVALTGTAAALPGKNKVDSGDIKNAQVKLSDLAADSVDGSKVADNSLKGADVDEGSLNIPQQAIPASLPPSGAAGGDLTGTFPDPQVQESGLIAAGDITGALNATSIANNTIGVNEPVADANDEIVDGGIDTEDVQNNNLASTDIAADTLTASDIANTDSIGDQELDDVTRSVIIPASELNPASVADDAPTNDAGFGFTATSKAAAVEFDPDTDEAVNLIAQVPDDRVAGTNMSLVVHSDSPAPAQAVVDWTLQASSYGNFDAANVAPSFAQNSLDIVDSNIVSVHSLNIPAANISSGEMLYVRLLRNADSGSDTLAADVKVHLFELEYTAER